MLAEFVKVVSQPFVSVCCGGSSGAGAAHLFVVFVPDMFLREDEEWTRQQAVGPQREPGCFTMARQQKQLLC